MIPEAMTMTSPYWVNATEVGFVSLIAADPFSPRSVRCSELQKSYSCTLYSFRSAITIVILFLSTATAQGSLNCLRALPGDPK